MQKQSSPFLVATNITLEQIQTFSQRSDLDFTKAEKERIMNAMREINPLLEQNGLDWNYFNTPERRNNLVNELMKVAYLKLNLSAKPREAYAILRDTKTGKKNEKGYDVYERRIEIGIEGAGNDVIMREFGVDVADLYSYIVYEGDDFTFPELNGWDYILPKHKRLYKSTKPLYAVYLVKHKDGRTEVLIASREDVKKSLLAHIRQNGASEDRLRELEKHSIDDLLSKTEFVNGKITKEKYNQTTKKYELYEVPLIGMGWISAVSRDSMIERKLKNHAIRKYPKDFTNENLAQIYESTYDERYDKQGNLIIEAEKVDAVENNEEHFDANTNNHEVPGVGQSFTVEQEDEEALVEKVDEPKVVNDDAITSYMNKTETKKEPEVKLSDPTPTTKKKPDWL